MLGKTANGLFWMSRYLERSENMARLVEAGFRIALTRSAAEDEWSSILTTAAARDAYLEHYDSFEGPNVINFLLRDKRNPGCVMSIIESARHNARMVRTGITREVWEATNDTWMSVRDAMARPIRDTELPAVLALIRQQSALVRGAMHGTMQRNDIFNFARLGTFIERADSTARIIDVKYYLLLPSVSLVGSSLDNVQWEVILRSTSAMRAFRWLQGSDTNPVAIADFLILDTRMPRSLAFCVGKIHGNLSYLCSEYGERQPSIEMASEMLTDLRARDIDSIVEDGLHEFLQDFLNRNAQLAIQIQNDYRFNT